MSAVPPKRWTEHGRRPGGSTSPPEAARSRWKRIAIATRWGMATAGPADARLSVRDPVEEGEPHTQEEKDALFIGMLRLHIANLIKPLGHAELADALRGLTLQSFPRRLEGETQRASLLDTSPVRDVDKASAAMDGLIGGIVTRAGPLNDAGVEPADQEALSRLNLRPVFVGVEHELILGAAIDAEPQAIRSRLAEKGVRTSLHDRTVPAAGSFRLAKSGAS